MKAWEKHQVDLYLLANDILENLLYQKSGYKSRFYYAFNDDLVYTQSNGDYVSQLKLLQQLADTGALSFTVKDPPKDIPQEFMGKNALTAKHKKFIQLHINAPRFSQFYEKLKPYAPDQDQPLLQKDRKLYLRKEDTAIIMRPTNDKAEYLVGTVRAGQTPSDILGYLINEKPNVLVSRSMLAVEGLNTSRKLNEIARDAFLPLAYKVFVEVRKADYLKILNPHIVDHSKLELLILEAQK